MGAERVVRHELIGDLLRQRRIESPLDIDCRQFPVFARIVRLQFLSLAFEVGLLGIRLGMHGNIFAGRHRHGTRDQAGKAGDEHAAVAALCRRDAEDQAGRGNNAVIRPQHRCAQPADTVSAVMFPVTLRHVPCPYRLRSRTCCVARIWNGALPGLHQPPQALMLASLLRARQGIRRMTMATVHPVRSHAETGTRAP